MQNQEERLFEAALAKLATLYGKTLPPARVAAYFGQLRDLPWSVVERVLDTIGRSQKYFPTVWEIREAARTSGLVSEPKGSYPPDVAAQRLRYGLDVMLPVRGDKNARFGQRWGIEPKPGMTYDDIVAEGKRRGVKAGDPQE